MLRRPGFLLLLLAVAVLSACGSEEGDVTPPSRSPDVLLSRDLWSAAWKTRSEELAWSDLPGIQELNDLPPEARLASIAAAELIDCPCGCESHTIADCLNRVEGCLTSEDQAREIVAEARRQWESAGGAEPVPASPAEEAKPEPETDSSVDADSGSADTGDDGAPPTVIQEDKKETPVTTTEGEETNQP